MPLLSARNIILFFTSSAVSFVPTDLDNLVGWFDRNDESTLFQESSLTTPAETGDPLGGWVNKGSGNDFLQATADSRPTVRADGVEGDGTDDFMSQTVSAGTYKTIVCVSKRVGGAASNERAFGNNSSANFGWTNTVGGQYLINEAFGTVDTNELGSDYRAVAIRYHSTSLAEIDIDGGFNTTFDPRDTFNTASDYGLFARDAAGISPGNTQIAEFIAYSDAKSDGEITSIINYLVSKWGI